MFTLRQSGTCVPRYLLTLSGTRVPQYLLTLSCIKFHPELGTIAPFPGEHQQARSKILSTSYPVSCLICHSLSDFSLHFNCLLHQPFYPFQFCTPFRSFQSIIETYFTIGHHSALSFKPMSNNTNFQFVNLTSIHILATFNANFYVQ